MMSDSFIENVISPEPESGDVEMIYREFYGLESVASTDEYESSERHGGDD